MQQRAGDWAENNRSIDFLLNITACANAESWQETAQNKQPAPTVLQTDFIQNSRFAITKANRRRNILLTSAVVGMIAASILAVFAFVQMNEADKQKRIAEQALKEVDNVYEFSKKKKFTETAEQLEKEDGRLFQDALADGGKGPKMIWLEAGEFQMGDIQGAGGDDEKPVHKVSIPRFAMSRYEVTVAEFKQFVEVSGYQTEAEKGDGCYVFKAGNYSKKKDANWRNPYFYQQYNQPVVCVSWNDATAYVEWLSKQTKKPYRLPSEAEWEYAARAGTKTKYYWGNQSGVNWGNFADSASQWSNQQTAPVGSFIANPFGLYDTVGNVWEWVADPWHGSYQGAPSDGSVWKGEEDRRVLRGGSFVDNSYDCRAASRDRGTSDLRIYFLGFRVVVGAVAWTP